MLDFFLDQNTQINISKSNETDESEKNTPAFIKQDRNSQFENESAEVCDDDEERGVNVTSGTRFSNFNQNRRNSKISSNSHDSFE